MKKTISIVVPAYNEEENIYAVYERICKLFKEKLSNYEFELLFEDNYSTDNTRPLLEKLCSEDHRVKAVFNAKNFGYTRSMYYALLQSTGDASVLMYADMQDPPEVIPEFVKKWEEGYLVVTGIKAKNDESFFMNIVRKMYYGMMRKISDVEHIENYNGFGLYDRSFLDILRNIHDPYPYFRGMVAELAPKRCSVKYEHVARERGKTHFNFMRLYDVAMHGLTSYSKALMRIATFVGGGVGIISLILALFVFIKKLINWDSYPVGTASITILILFIGSMLMFFLGILGEYIISMSLRTMDHPLIIEEKRINFDEEKQGINNREDIDKK